MTEQLSRYGKGMFIKKMTFTNRTTGEDFDVLKLGIIKNEFLKNPFNDNGWGNFEIRFRTTGEPYIVVDATYNNIYSTVKTEYSTVKTKNTTDSQAIELNDGNEEEIPF